MTAGRTIAQLTVDRKRLKAKNRKLWEQLKEDFKNESKYIIIYVRERLNGRNLVGLGTLGPYPAAHNCNIFVHSVYLQMLF